MENNKLYVVLIDEEVDYESNINFEIFRTHEGAKEFFNEKIKQYKENFGYAFTNGVLDEGYEEDIDEDSYAIWEEGCYAENHASVRIITKNFN